eukprot:932448-Pleurochrysis_carterae.AAC.1
MERIWEGCEEGCGKTVATMWGVSTSHVLCSDASTQGKLFKHASAAWRKSETVKACKAKHFWPWGDCRACAACRPPAPCFAASISRQPRGEDEAPVQDFTKQRIGILCKVYGTRTARSSCMQLTCATAST